MCIWLSPYIHPIILGSDKRYFLWKLNENVNGMGTEERLRTIGLGKYLRTRTILSVYLMHDFYIWNPIILYFRLSSWND